MQQSSHTVATRAARNGTARLTASIPRRGSNGSVPGGEATRRPPLILTPGPKPGDIVGAASDFADSIAIAIAIE
jgi:hypothetical protein